MYKYLFGLLFLAFTVQGSFLNAQNIPSRPAGLVNDFANVLSSGEKNALEQKLRAYQNSTTIQIAVVTINSLQGEDDFDFAFRLASDWGIGQSEEDNGILLFIAREDRKVRFVTGPGTQGFLPDIMAKRIIEEYIVPAFRQGQYYRGIDQATTQVMQLGQGEYTNDNPQPTRTRAKGGIPSLAVILFLIILIIIFSRLGGGSDDDDDGGYYRGGRYDMDKRYRRRQRRGGGGGGWIFFPGGFGGGGGGGGGFGDGGGDSFGGFGGGGFDGGGAWGEW